MGAVEPRLDWAASRYAEGWLDRENLLEGVDQDIAYSVDIERSGERFDNAAEVCEAPLRVTHLFLQEDGQWRIAVRHADFLQPRQEPRRLSVPRAYGICACLLYTSPSPRDPKTSRMPSSA